jgi:hypothetical protein
VENGAFHIELQERSGRLEPIGITYYYGDAFITLLRRHFT